MTATASLFTASITFVNYLTRQQETRSYTGTQEAVQSWLSIRYFHAGDNVISAGILPAEVVKAETRKALVVETARRITRREDAAELDAIRYSLESGTAYHKTNRRSPNPR